MKRQRVCAALLAAVLGGCAWPSSSYVEADRKTYAAVEPAFRGYVEADAALDATQRESRLLVLESWRLRLEAAEEAAR